MNNQTPSLQFEGRKLFSALLFVLTLPWCVDAFAYDLQPRQVAYYKSGNETARLRFLFELVKSGKSDVAEALLRSVPLEGPYAQNRTLFIEGLILEARNDLSGAIQNFRTALANDPKLNMVRSELARVLAREGEFESSKHHLELLAGESQSPEQRQQVEGLIAQLDASRPLRFNGFISVAPSSNLFQGSSHTTVSAEGLVKTQGGNGFGEVINKKASGVGAAIGGSATYTHSISNSFQAVITAGAVANLYTDYNFDSAGLSQSAELRSTFQDGFVSFGAVASESLSVSANPLTYYSFGPRFTVGKAITEQDQLTGTATVELRRNPRDSDYNGGALLLSGTWIHSLDSTSNLAVLASFEKIELKNEAFSYVAGTAGLGFYKEMPWGLTVQGQSTLRLSAFDAVNPIALKFREDKRLAADLALTKRDLNWFGFAPSVNYSYVRNFSNIETFDFDSHSVDFRLTKDF